MMVGGFVSVCSVCSVVKKTVWFSRGYGDYGRWPMGVPVICELSANGNGSKLF